MRFEVAVTALNIIIYMLFTNNGVLLFKYYLYYKKNCMDWNKFK